VLEQQVRQPLERQEQGLGPRLLGLPEQQAPVKLALLVLDLLPKLQLLQVRQQELRLGGLGRRRGAS